MSQKFTPLAQSRASYYCKGSPVHFVMVELFRMEGTGATVVTLTFKNLFSRPLVSFTAYFRCKNKYGEVVVEDSFTYDNVYAGEGECFGFDDAVFVSDEPLGSVEVRLSPMTTERLMTCAAARLWRCLRCGPCPSANARPCAARWARRMRIITLRRLPTAGAAPAARSITTRAAASVIAASAAWKRC